MKEVKLKRYAEPFNDIPYKNYVQSPIGLVPKAGGKTRLIFHLSYDFKRTRNESVNAYTRDEVCTVKYRDLDYAVCQSLRLLKEIDTATASDQPKSIWYGISDLESAFCILPLKPGVFWLLVMKAWYPVMGELFYFIDKCLLFGHCISCAMFQRFSDALGHMVSYLLRIRRQIMFTPLTNYLDDFLFATLTTRICHIMIQTFLDMCGQLGVPVSKEKTQWGSQIVVFLGILLDGKFLIVAVPDKKRLKTINTIQQLLDKKSATVKEIQSFTGLLNFLNKAVVPGRAFTRRMYMKFSRIEKGKLKEHHHVCLDVQFKSDCKVWLDYLTNSMHGINRPFMDMSEVTTAEVLDFYSDATKGHKLGMGGIFNKQWYFAQWEEGYIEQYDPSIEYLELLAVCMSVHIWAKQLQHRRIILFCDYQSVVSMINNMTAGCHNCMVLIRKLVLLNLKMDTNIFCPWVKGVSNRKSDMLSRQKITQFKQAFPKMDEKPEDLHQDLWPASKLWVNK